MSMWFVNEFHIQILALEFLLCRRLPRREAFWLRLLPLAAAYIALPAFISGGFNASALRAGGWFSFSFLLMSGLSALLLWFTFRISLKQLVLCCCVSNTLQHMVHSADRMICFSTGLTGSPAQLLHLLLMLLMLGLVLYFLEKNHMLGIEKVELKNTHLIVFAIISSFMVYVVSTWSLRNEGRNIGEQFFDFSCCLLLICILMDLFRFSRSEHEQLVLLQLLRHEQEQHKMSRANIEVINRKCHDLRHQISALRHLPTEEQEKSISELESAILIYDSLVKTGNDDLDIIIAEKSFAAEKMGVRLQCVVEGARLSFMRPEDICSLFGNALDNAIEAAAREKNPDLRIVTLQTAVQGNMLTIHIINPCAAAPAYLDGLPVTTKEDTDFHGYGMRSMRFVTEKYGGVLTTGWEKGVFSLDVLFLLN